MKEINEKTYLHVYFSLYYNCEKHPTFCHKLNIHNPENETVIVTIGPVT
jgi:hypothetical protein